MDAFAPRFLIHMRCLASHTAVKHPDHVKPFELDLYRDLLVTNLGAGYV